MYRCAGFERTKQHCHIITVCHFIKEERAVRFFPFCFATFAWISCNINICNINYYKVVLE